MRKMKGRLFCILLVLQIVSWVSVAKRPFPPAYYSTSHPGTQESAPPKSSPSSTIKSETGVIFTEGTSSSEMMQGAYEKAVVSISSKIGSSPPSCEHKCYGCTPCEAIQVPSNSKRTSHFGIQYSNYEPESWKCKCGPFFYSP